MIVNFIHRYSYKKHFLINIVITCNEKIMLQKMLVSEKKMSDLNFEWLKKH